MNCAIHIEFVDRGDKTLVIAWTSMQSTSFMMSLMMPFIRGSVRKRQGGDLDRFKTKLEAGELAL